MVYTEFVQLSGHDFSIEGFSNPLKKTENIFLTDSEKGFLFDLFLTFFYPTHWKMKYRTETIIFHFYKTFTI